MEIWLRKCSSFEEERKADLEFWQRMTPGERVDVVEELRQEWWDRHGGGSEPKIEGVVRVIRRSKS